MGKGTEGLMISFPLGTDRDIFDSGRSLKWAFMKNTFDGETQESEMALEAASAG